MRRFIVALVLSPTVAFAQSGPTKEQSQQIARVAVQFMDRVQITGAEAQNLIAVKSWLDAITRGELDVVFVPKPPIPKKEPPK